MKTFLLVMSCGSMTCMQIVQAGEDASVLPRGHIVPCVLSVLMQGTDSLNCHLATT